MCAPPCTPSVATGARRGESGRCVTLARRACRVDFLSLLPRPELNQSPRRVREETETATDTDTDLCSPSVRARSRSFLGVQPQPANGRGASRLLSTPSGPTYRHRERNNWAAARRCVGSPHHDRCLPVARAARDFRTSVWNASIRSWAASYAYFIGVTSPREACEPWVSCSNSERASVIGRV